MRFSPPTWWVVLAGLIRNRIPGAGEEDQVGVAVVTESRRGLGALTMSEFRKATVKTHCRSWRNATARWNRVNPCMVLGKIDYNYNGTMLAACTKTVVFHDRVIIKVSYDCINSSRFLKSTIMEMPLPERSFSNTAFTSWPSWKYFQVKISFSLQNRYFFIIFDWIFLSFLRENQWISKRL